MIRESQDLECTGQAALVDHFEFIGLVIPENGPHGPLPILLAQIGALVRERHRKREVV